MGVVIEKSRVTGPFETIIFQSEKYSDYVLKVLSKRNCKHCYGRGKLKFDNPSTGMKWVTTCDCIHRRGIYGRTRN